MPRLDLDRWPGALLAYLLVAGLICFWRIGATGVVSMEGMVADGARHMIESGDWIVPHVYGEMYTFKPALAYWLAAIPMQLSSPPPEGLLRLPFAISGFLMGLAVLLWIGRLAGRRIGLLSALAAIGGGLFLQKARMAEFDMPLAAGVGVAIAAACYNLSAPRPRAAVWLLGYLGLAFGFLAKGSPALMVFGPGLLAAAVVTGRPRRLGSAGHLAGAALFTILCGGYLWALWDAAGPRGFEQPLGEAQVRGFAWSAGELARAPAGTPRYGADQLGGESWKLLGRTLAKPLLIAVAFLPWSLVVPFGWHGWRRRRAGGEVTSNLLRAGWAFLLAGVVTFMVVPTHEMRYYLPLAVPLGIVCGITLGSSWPASRALRRTCATAAAIAVAYPLLTMLVPRLPLAAPERLLLLGIGAAAALAVISELRGRARPAVLVAIAALCAIAPEYLGFQPYRAGRRNLESQATELARHVPADEPVWIQGPADTGGKSSSLFYYLDRPIRTFASNGDPPPHGSYCLFPSDRFDELGSPPFDFQEIVRASHPWRTYHLGLCRSGGNASPTPAGGG